MHKTKTTLKDHIVFGIACIIASAVLMLSLHIKDLVKYRIVESNDVNVKYADVTAKATSDMHNHVEKQIMKTFQNFNDGSVIASRNRDDVDAFVEEDPGLWGRLSEQLYLWGVFITMPFSRFV
jgi:hypothetical protein